MFITPLSSNGYAHIYVCFNLQFVAGSQIIVGGLASDDELLSIVCLFVSRHTAN